MAAQDSYCTVLLSTEKATSANVTQEEIMKNLESNDVKVKVSALKQAVMLLLAGEQLPRVLMQVIRFCINTEDNMLKKYMMLYWEVVKKYDAGRKLLPEMILVCNAMRNDLISPNEFVRGCMLRFLCKLREPELLEPLIPSIKQCLDHRHAFVRRNAALTIFSIHHSFGQQLIPDAPEIIERFLQSETDVGARRNGFLFLYNEAEDLATEFLENHSEEVLKYGDGFALGALELTRKVCRRDPNQKSRFVRPLFGMLRADSAAVSYEAAWTLASLSAAPTAVRAAATTYSTLLNSQSDNNVKLIVLERLMELKKKHTKVLQEVVMDILRALNSPNIDICKKTLEVALELISPRNIEEVVQLLKREVVKTQESDLDKDTEYRGVLIRAIHHCAARFPDVAESVVHTLMDFLNGDSAVSVVLFVRDIGEQYPHLRESVLCKLIMNFPDMKSPSVLGVALWILGEYCTEGNQLDQAFEEIKSNLAEPPFTFKSAEDIDAAKKIAPESKITTKNVILSDGTYATQSISTLAIEDKTMPELRKHVASGDFFLCAELGSALTKLALRKLHVQGEGDASAKAMQTSALVLICGMATLLEAKNKGQMGAFTDCLEKLALCCRALLDPERCGMLREALTTTTRDTFGALLATRQKTKAKEEEQNQEKYKAQPDELITFRQLRRVGAQGAEFDIDDGEDLSRATGEGDRAQTKLRHVYQLSGFSDPVYSEAIVTVHDYDIVLEILIINRTPNTLTNLTVELATMGDLKLVERPQSYTIGPLDQRSIRTNIKVSSTETGHIFGTIVYENSSTAEKTYINLNDIHLDIMDYIAPGTCTDDNFRRMWEEFEWENKVAINTAFVRLTEYLEHIIVNTNMTCLTPTSALGGESSFLAANLYAKSIFGEDVLVNVSVEKKDDADGKLSGYVRIRSKTQGIALSLGDRITIVQRGPSQANEQP